MKSDPPDRSAGLGDQPRATDISIRRLEGQAAIVTAGATGIGRAVVRRLASEGADVLITTHKRSGDGAADDVSAAGRRAIVVNADVGDPTSADVIVDAAREAFGRVDLLVNNAGVGAVRTFFDLSPDDWEQVFRLNARGLFFCMQTVARVMRQQGHGCIVNIASIAGRRGRPLFPHYAASKAAVLSLTQSAAISLAPYGIRVNAVCPGIVDTDIWQRIAPAAERELERPSGSYLEERVREVPLGRMAFPEEIAGVVAFLASRDADYVTGQAYNVCGGLEFN